MKMFFDKTFTKFNMFVFLHFVSPKISCTYFTVIVVIRQYILMIL